ncbi:MAG: alpha/beta fold hydrolase [Defluviitaleaceae bacterium]|nr:alpha/beta fold hydrolase [Defluviitaleaceae bacterium]
MIKTKPRFKKIVALAIFLVIILNNAVFVLANSPLETLQQRSIDGVIYVPMRLTAYAHNATIEWDSLNHAVILTMANGKISVISIETAGGFIEDGISWITFEYAVNLFGISYEMDIEINYVINNEIDVEITHETDVLFHVEEVIVGKNAQWALDATLTVPVEASLQNPVPGVVLVHGSGPHDRNQEIVPGHANFYEIASHLSSNGIAVLRYDKRTFTHGMAMVEELGITAITVWEETIEDAILAAEILRTDTRISEVFMIGHSLGGIMAPRIHAHGGNFDGLIFKAGSPRFLLEISLDQNVLLIEAMDEGPERDATVAQMEAFAQEIYALSDMSREEVQDVELAGAGGYYWWDLLHNPVSNYIISITNIPVLVMQGENDFQVTVDEDFYALQQLLVDHNNVTFILYPGLNHFFMPTTATNILEAISELTIPSTIYHQVLQDIVDWIHSNSALEYRVDVT